MFKNAHFDFGITIEAIADCDFSLLEQLDNHALLQKLDCDSPKLKNFIEKEMGAFERYWSPNTLNALDLARSALARLIEKNQALPQQADFVIYCGISNPYPVTTLSAKLANEFKFSNYPSCWDIKSGCSSGLLALIQSIQLFACGARSGVIICSETLSKFCNPKTLQMAAAIGDGAVALHVSKSTEWKINAICHGSDPNYSHLMIVPGEFPIDPNNFSPEKYKFEFLDKNTGLQKLSEHWVNSLKQLTEQAKIEPDKIQLYVPHQVDDKKNLAVAKACNISEHQVARNFAQFGNMGCPTVFLNYLKNYDAIEPGKNLVLHAVGGGISWAGICLEKL